MAEINDLIHQIENPELRERIQQAVDRMNKQKKFGLVFEEHLPECTPLYDIPVRKGSRVALKAGLVSKNYIVLDIADGEAVCLHKVGAESEKIPVSELVSVAEFGEPIYPYLKPIDTVCNAPNNDLWHTLIEADNYHALQLLEYLYAGKVDCIYIDPPYNTGARDWKYNNDYVDGNDTYRHSKWLSMMKKRLALAKKLLNPKDSVLIVTIDEKEYLHLGCLLEDMFSEARMQMISSVINPTGVARMGEFSRTDEYIYFIFIGDAAPCSITINTEEWMAGQTQQNNVVDTPFWRMLRRSGSHDERSERPNLFYPIYLDKKSGRILNCGDSLPIDTSRDTVKSRNENIEIVWPIKKNGNEGCWQLSQNKLFSVLADGYVRAISRNENGWVITYLASGEVEKIKQGVYVQTERTGINNEWTVRGTNAQKSFVPGTQWRIKSHSARHFGSMMLNQTIGETRFSFPKSLYAVHDTIRFFVANKPNALILDFFAGSGTTLHAVNLLNSEDGGQRRCIIVTNNEVSAEESKALTEKGYHPGDEEWNALGIARYVTWPRTVCSIEGHDVKGNPLKGNYIGSDLPMADGFKANAAFFKLGFLDKTSVALGRQFKEMLPTLWMKAGAHGPCPMLTGEATPTMLVLPENRFAVLTVESAFNDFAEQVNARSVIETVYIVTDYEAGYRAMAKNLNAPHTFQLYRNYLDNFRINTGRN